MEGANGGSFKEETLLKLLQLTFTDDKTRISHAAIAMTGELIRILVTEAAMRSARRTAIEVSDQVSIEHIEKILPQLLLDF